MKKFYSTIIKTFLLAVVAVSLSCESEDPKPEDFTNDPGSDYYGSWKRDGVDTWVKFEGSTATTCGATGQEVGTFDASEPSMTFVMNGETITFPLEFSGDTMWMGVPGQYVDTNVAARYTRSSTFCGDDDGGGSGDGGEITFWIQNDLGCGNIYVTLEGQGSGTITSYYSSSPSCGASGCANFSVPAGTYTFSASCDGYTWNSTISVTDGQCSKMQLY